MLAGIAGFIRQTQNRPEGLPFEVFSETSLDEESPTFLLNVISMWAHVWRIFNSHGFSSWGSASKKYVPVQLPLRGSQTFSGSQIDLKEGSLGTLVTVALKLPGDTGGLTATVPIPQISGVTRDVPVDFDTVLIEAASRGTFQAPGPALTYTVTQIRAVARNVIVPL